MASPARRLWPAGLLLVVAACSTSGPRDAGDRALFESYPPAVRENIRKGIVEVGYTPEMVRMAWGEPDRKTHIGSEDGAREIWTWQQSRPGIGIGLGTGRSIGSHVGIGTHVSVGKPPRTEERAVVEFRNGRVERFRATAAD